MARRGLVVRRLALCSSVDPRVLVYTLRTGGQDKTPRDPEQTRESSLQRTPGILTASTTPVVVIIHWRKKKKTSLSLQGIGLSRVISVLHSEQKCVKLFSDFFGTSAGSGVQVLLDMKSTRNSPNRLFLYTHRV